MLDPNEHIHLDLYILTNIHKNFFYHEVNNKYTQYNKEILYSQILYKHLNKYLKKIQYLIFSIFISKIFNHVKIIYILFIR